MSSSRAYRQLLAMFMVQALLMASTGPALARSANPDTVYFPSADHQTELVAYLFHSHRTGPHPAVVMLHGRAGPYSSNVNADCTVVGRTVASPCSAHTLTKRHMSWGEHWADLGYDALLVDSFGPRGRGHGYAKGSHDDPDRDAVNERTVRPLDAEGALAWLAQQPDVQQEHIYLQGWSNGGSTVLNTLHRQATGTAQTGHKARFAAAVALYPGCGPKAMLARTIKIDTPLLMLIASDDEEVSPQLCEEMAQRAGAAAGNPKFVIYPGATHDFDDPGATRQLVAGNQAAKADAFRRVSRLFAQDN